MGTNHQELEIKKLAMGGAGVAFSDGSVGFVKGGLPGDLVVAEPKKAGKRSTLYHGVRLSRGAEQRRPYACSHRHADGMLEGCGGCPWGNLPESFQLEWKQQVLGETLARLAGITVEPGSVATIPSGRSTGYRPRLRLQLAADDNGVLGLHFKEAASNHLVRIHSCLLAEPAVAAAIAEVRQRLQVLPNLNLYGAQLEFTALEQGVLAAVLPGRSSNKAVGRLRGALAKIPGLEVEVVTKDVAKAAVHLYETWEGIAFHTAAGVFQQNNRLVNHQLRRLVLELAQEYQVQEVVDLFCGAGNLSLGLAAAGIKVQGFEINPLAIKCAQRSLAQLSLKESSYQVSGLKQLGRLQPKQGARLAIIDPPRQGFKDHLHLLTEVAADALLLIGCDGACFSRDCGLLQRQGWRLQRLWLCDMFPQTAHLEAVSLWLAPKAMA